MKWIDAFLDRITMYRLLVYYLIGLLSAAVVLSVFGMLQYEPLDIVFSALCLCATTWVTNKLFSFAFKAPTNVESPYITAMILALIISPSHTIHGLVFLTAAGVLAMASKYVLAWHDRHFFNPAAIAVVLTGLIAGDSASWWVGTVSMVPFVLLGGILLVRRVRRTQMVAWFVGTALLATVLYGLLNGSNPATIVQQELLSSSLFFTGFVMLIEPLTSPTTKGKRAWYSVLVGALFPPQFHIFGLYSTPELALVVGNIFAYIVGPRAKTFLHLKKQTALTRDSTDFAFTPERRVSYQPGQYMEFTFQHPHTDARGARRYFTIASSPTEQELHIGIKFYDPSSSFKKAMHGIDAATPIIAGQVGGDFTLPKDPTQKVAFIAGGIGITPFRSMIKYLIDTEQKRDIVLLYGAKTPEDLAYRAVFDEAVAKLGIRVIYAVDSGETKPPQYQSRVDEQLIRKHVPDFAERLFYASGPHGMVVGAETTLRTMGVARRRIKKDFFSGYA